MSLDEGATGGLEPRPPVPGEEQAPRILDEAPSPQKHHVDLLAALKRDLQRASMSCAAAGGKGSPEGAQEQAPACLRWAHSLHHLLKDDDGVKLFRMYLEAEGKAHADTLNFWLACEGLRQQLAPEELQQRIKTIHRIYFVKSALPIPEDLRKEIGTNIKSSACLHLPVTLFDEAQATIENLIATTTYPNFLKSDTYLQFLENAQKSSSSGSISEFSCDDALNAIADSDPLPTLHEDIELTMAHPSHTFHFQKPSNTGDHTPTPYPLRLTKDILLKSAKSRALDIRPKSEAFAGLLARGRGGAHAAYSSYNPVSRQDSELHSLSSHSDARTDSDAISVADSSVDRRSMTRQSLRQAILDSRKIRELATLNRETDMNQIRIPRTQRIDKSHIQPMDREKFTFVLMAKLEAVRREQEVEEMLDKKLKESESMSSMSDIQAQELSNAIRAKLQLEEENDQDILDDHVSKVFPDTPGRSPPGSWTPPKTRHGSSRRRKEGSMFSGDSGNLRDFAEGSEHRASGMVKSRTMPEYGEDRFCRGALGWRSSSRKTLTDSGVSVVSDTPPVSQHKEKVLAWLDSTGRSGPSHTHSDMSSKHRSNPLRATTASSPVPARHTGRRSNSAERPAFLALPDTALSVPQPPNTELQLEEARRRLMAGGATRQPAQSCQSTMRRGKAGKADEYVTAMITFCDEKYPYRTKIPGSMVTLRQFKDYLPKKGNYRYFFKTVCEELGNQVIQEEVSQDADVLPLWEGRIMAQVKPLD